MSIKVTQSHLGEYLVAKKLHAILKYVYLLGYLLGYLDD